MAVRSAIYALGVTSFRQAQIIPTTHPTTTGTVHRAVIQTVLPQTDEKISIASVVALDSTHIRVTFQPASLKNNAALSSRDNWRITPSLSVYASVPQATTNPGYVDLTIDEQKNGEIYQIEALRIASSAETPITGTWVGVGVLPSVVSVVGHSSTVVRVSFSEGMKVDSALLDPGSYTLVTGSGSVARSVVSVTPENTTAPAFVDLNLSGEMTIGSGNYTLGVSALLVDAAGNPITGTLSFAFNGKGTRPEIVAVRTHEDSIDSIRVTFSKDVKMINPANYNDALRIANYAITSSAARQVVISSVVAASTFAVILAVSGQSTDVDYTLTIQNVQDLANNAIAT